MLRYKTTQKTHQEWEGAGRLGERKMNKERRGNLDGLRGSHPLKCKSTGFDRLKKAFSVIPDPTEAPVWWRTTPWLECCSPKAVTERQRTTRYDSRRPLQQIRRDAVLAQPCGWSMVVEVGFQDRGPKQATTGRPTGQGQRLLKTGRGPLITGRGGQQRESRANMIMMG